MVERASRENEVRAEAEASRIRRENRASKRCVGVFFGL